VSSPPPGTPPGPNPPPPAPKDPTPPPPPKPHQDPNVPEAFDLYSPEARELFSPGMLEIFKWNAFIDAFLKAIEPMSTLEEVENYLKSIDPKKLPNILLDKELGSYIEFGKVVATDHWDSKRQDCPDLTKVYPRKFKSWQQAPEWG